MPRKVERRGSALPFQSMMLLATACSGLSMLCLTYEADGPAFSRTAPRSDGDGSTTDTLEMGNFRTWHGDHVRLRDIARNGPDPGRQRLVHVAIRAPIVNGRCAPLASAPGINHCRRAPWECGGEWFT